MAKLVLTNPKASLAKIASVTVKISPLVNESGQFIPFVLVELNYGSEENGIFVPLSSQTLRFEGSQFMDFLGRFQTLEGEVLTGVSEIAGILGTVEDPAIVK